MSNKELFENVNTLTNDICEKLGRLTGNGVFSIKEGMELIKVISDKQYRWMQSKFSEEEIRELISNR